MSTTADPVRHRSVETVDVAGRTLPLSLVFDFDTRRWGLRELVSAYFGTDDLETLHLDPRWNPHETSLPLPNHAVTRNSWDVSRSLRDAVIARASPLLKSLVYDHVASFAGPIRGHQETAMMRVNFHGSRSILRFHKDLEYGQKANAINIWLPVTEVCGSNSLFVESSPGLSDFAPVELRYGQALMFYGTDLVHGAVDNVSGGTRISFDLRFSV